MGKSWYESKTLWGVVAMVAAFTSAKLGVVLDVELLKTELVGAAEWAVGVAGFVWTLRGRFLAIIRPAPGAAEAARKSLFESKTVWAATAFFVNFAWQKITGAPLDVAGLEQLLIELVPWTIATVTAAVAWFSRLKATAAVTSILPQVEQ